jgi:tetratricopeptide (TPR) repeat protein
MTVLLPNQRIRGMCLFGARFLSILLVFLSVAQLPAENLRDHRFIEKTQEGFSYIYNFDYDKARQTFTALEKEYPKHPAPPLYLAVIHWLEEMLRRQDLTLNRFVSASYFSKETLQVMPPKEREAFLQALRKSERLTNAILQKNRTDKDGRYFLATAFGLRASFAITVDHSMREAFSAGNKADSIARRLIAEDPNYYDAYLVVGTYEYIAGSIPWILKWITYLIGIHGNKQDGLAHIKIAVEKGQYVKTEAEMVQMVMHVRDNRYAEALAVAQSLKNKFPRNFLFAINYGQILLMAGQKDQGFAALQEVETRAEAGEPNFNRLPLPIFRFNLGLELMHRRQLDLAEERFRKCIENPKTPPREKALSHLCLGRILEWKHKGEDAVKAYQAVLGFPDVDDSHRQAKEYLDKLMNQ